LLLSFFILYSLNKTLPPSFASSISFGLFCLGDQAYGDLFCAAGRKWAIRLLQLGATQQHIPTIGYGDDGDAAGVFGELDHWIQSSLLPNVTVLFTNHQHHPNKIMNVAATRPHCSLNVEPSTESITTSEVNTSNDKNENEEWQKTLFANAYRDFFTKTMCPSTAYRYDHGLDHNAKHSVIRRHDDQNANNDYNNEDYRPPTLLVGTVVANQRITSPDWERQDTRHVRIRIRASDNCPLSPSTAKKNGAGDGTDPKRANAPFVGDATSVTISATTTHQHLPYRAGDIATIIPQNTNDEVSALLQVLPESIQALVDAVLTIQPNNNNLIWPPPVL